MSLSDSYRAARSLEAIENYARADDPLSGRSKFIQENESEQRSLECHLDEEFWSPILSEPTKYWDAKINLFDVALSEWVARVPGLYWSPGSQALRGLATQAIEKRSNGWTIYKPLGKSSKVLGGVGTLKFPPDEQGHRLVTLTFGFNASTGIPAFIAPQVWKDFKLREGDYFRRIVGTWRKMSIAWAEQFPSTEGIPRGYLVIDFPAQMEKSERDAPIQFHPCTVMEYSKGDALLYDFVYCTADTKVAKYQAALKKFFSEYKNSEERYGRYLLSPDINEPDPIIEAEYSSPAALRRAGPGERAHMDLLVERVRHKSFRGQDIERIIEILSHNCDEGTLERLSSYIKIPRGSLLTKGKKIGDLVALLLDICIRGNKVEALLDRLAFERPDLITAGS